MKRVLLIISLIVAFAASPVAAQTQRNNEQKPQVDILLALGADVSRSIDFEEYSLQKQGYKDAFVDPRVLFAIKNGALGRIGVTYFEWSDMGEQVVQVDWMLIDGESSGKQFGSMLSETKRTFGSRTSISAAIGFGMERVAKAPFSSNRKVIDISGDGTSNSGGDVRLARDLAIRSGFTINGLVIKSPPDRFDAAHTNPPGGLKIYYAENVVGGPNSFVMEANGFGAFASAIIDKLLAEISMR